MAYFNGSTLKRNLLKATPLINIASNIPRDFKPDIAISYLEYEDAGATDNKCLSMTVFFYNNHSHQRQKGDWISWPLCLLPDISKILAKYFSNKSGELGLIGEFTGSQKRIYFDKAGSDLLVKAQLFKHYFNCWETVSCIKLPQEQVVVLVNFLKWFCLGHLEEIKTSQLRRKEKGGKFVEAAAI